MLSRIHRPAARASGGCLFDGTSNPSLTGKIPHFELGYIPQPAKELKAAAGFLITNPRAQANRSCGLSGPRAVRTLKIEVMTERKTTALVKKHLRLTASAGFNLAG
jgi:hypothetical protein